jgi:hypothetical protein
VHRIQDAGLEVWAGMIVGFDNDNGDVFETQRRFIENSRISLVMVGMLSAIPKTPLYTRLAKQGRLDLSDYPSYGTNVVPLQMSREALSRGYIQLMTDLYEPNAFFDRVDAPLVAEPGWRRFAATRRWMPLYKHARSWIESGVLMARIGLRTRDRNIRSYLERIVRTAGWDSVATLCHKMRHAFSSSPACLSASSMMHS